MLQTSGELTIVKDEGETVQVGEVIGYITPSEGGAKKRKSRSYSKMMHLTTAAPAADNTIMQNTRIKCRRY